MSTANDDKQDTVSLEPQERIPDDVDVRCEGGNPLNVADFQHRHDTEFDQQKQAFQRIPVEELERYKNQFVVSLNGRVVDHDEDLSTLTNRFFAGSGDIAVYITRIGEPIQITLRTSRTRS